MNDGPVSSCTCLISIAHELQVTLEISIGPSGAKTVPEKVYTPISDES